MEEALITLKPKEKREFKNNIPENKMGSAFLS